MSRIADKQIIHDESESKSWTVTFSIEGGISGLQDEKKREKKASGRNGEEKGIHKKTYGICRYL